MRRFLILAFLIFLFQPNLSSQNRFIESYQAGLYFGFRDLRIESFTNNSNLDFINYMNFLDYDPGGYPYIGISADFKMRNNFAVNLKIFSTDDIFPTSLNLSVQHYFNDYFGFSFGLYTYPLFTGNLEDYHKSVDIGYTLDLNQGDYRQRNIYDFGWIAGPVLKYEKGRFLTNLKFNLGISGFLPFREEFRQEKTNSNFRRIIKYETSFKKEFFLFPEFYAAVGILKLKNFMIGLQFQSNLMISKRSLDYTRTIYNWSFDNREVEKVSSPKHRFNMVDMDFGIFLKVLPGQ